MSTDLRVRVVLEHAGVRVELDAAELEARVASPGLARRLAVLLWEARGGRGSKRVLPSPGTLERLSDSSPSVSVRGIERKAKGGRDDGAVDSLASHLADALADRRSLTWYRKVAAELPRGVVLDALARARDIRRADVRRSRAALFTSIVRPLMKHPQRLCPPDPVPDENHA